MSISRAPHRRVHRRPPPPKGWLEGLIARWLAPIDALTGAIYSILIVLTFTLAFTVIKRGPGSGQPIPEDFGTELFFAVAGAAVAWGLIDGLMLALLAALERGEKHRFLHEIQAADGDEEAIEVIAEEFDFVLEPITSSQKRHLLYGNMLEHLRDSEPRPVGFQHWDWVEALGLAIVAVVAATPSLIPLYFLRHEPLAALRVSNVISFVMLFLLGYRWGYYTGASRWKTGLLLVLFAGALMAIAIPLGG